MQKLVLANIDTAGTTNRSPCNTVHRSLVAHGIGAHCTHFWSLGPGVRRARYIKMHCAQTNCESINMQGNHFQRSHMASAHICRKAFQSPHPFKTSQDKCRSLFWQILKQQEPQTDPLQHGAQISCSAWYRGPLYSFLEFGPGGPTRKIYQDALCSNKLRKRKHAG